MEQSHPSSPSVTSLDHLVLTVFDIKATCLFYKTVLGMRVEVFKVADGSERWALYFGVQKINLHQVGAEFDPKSKQPTSGSADLCFLTTTALADWADHLAHHDIDIEDGPVARTGATQKIMSIYIRDPDQNLIEISVPQNENSKGKGPKEEL